MKNQRFLSVLAATLLGVTSISAMAQDKPAAPNPSKGGEGSTISLKNGTTNPPQRPDGTDPVSRDAVKAETRAANRAKTIPTGEASTVGTMTKQPNETMQPTGDMSRKEVSMAARKTKPMRGDKVERPDVPTNPAAGGGTPK